MVVVVEDLILAAIQALLGDRERAVLEPAVAPLVDLPLEPQVEVVELPLGDDVAGLEHVAMDDPVLDRPAG